MFTDISVMKILRLLDVLKPSVFHKNYAHGSRSGAPSTNMD